MISPKKIIYLFGALLGWFALIGQFYLIQENRITSVLETTIRYFSFFTILTNLIVAVFYTAALWPSHGKLVSFFRKPDTFAAITVYITVVCLVYQLILRQIWNPVGLQRIVDELLHSVIPVYMLICWIFFGEKNKLAWKRIPFWMLYPLCYATYVLIRGAFSGFYPYPFLDVTSLGYGAVILNALGIMVLFLTLSTLLIFISKSTTARPIASP